jgi:hypothetical protein
MSTVHIDPTLPTYSTWFITCNNHIYTVSFSIGGPSPFYFESSNCVVEQIGTTERIRIGQEYSLHTLTWTSCNGPSNDLKGYLAPDFATWKASLLALAGDEEDLFFAV